MFILPQLKNLYGENQSQCKLELTEQFGTTLLQGFPYVREFDEESKTIIFIPCSNNSEILENNSQQRFKIICTTQNSSNFIISSQFKLLKQGNRITKYFKKSHNYLFQNGDHSTHFYIKDDILYIQFKQIRWGATENFITSKDFENEVKKFIASIDIQKIKNSIFQGEEKLNKNQDWVKNELQKLEIQSQMMEKSFTASDQKYNYYQPFFFINSLKDQNKQILFQRYYENGLYERKYTKKFTFELKQDLMHSLNQLQQQINGFLFQLSPQQQKILKNTFIQLAFDIKKHLCFQFDQETEDFNKMIQGEEFKNYSLKKQKKLIESVCIIYDLLEHSILNENYFNQNVFQVDRKGKLKINFLQSNELNKHQSNKQNQNFQSCESNKLHHLVELIAFIVQINQNKQLSEIDSENLVKLNQIVQYNSQRKKLQISQLLFLLNQIQFSTQENQQIRE
ncbi:unnamed protein product (macronuclear) [Paramecium tetraurelia]|uniref:Uncharacterized protein n=1 Tax=Paramecium tetraurelia TaxID=5888 RepID=A0CDU6_PARTE|nr:uncharacterized protein GSPATT00007175001 [Paramecium tetraurelia]CAK68963.1 unnamed protein product [Paramecium tetraurelia]|eukprot:XP_001436360.1 hypothetical protein (macronuclear) [Paramecium tetraurelia strain d4-2]